MNSIPAGTNVVAAELYKDCMAAAVKILKKTPLATLICIFKEVIFIIGVYNTLDLTEVLNFGL